MANTFLTPDIIAREALMVLRNNAVMSQLVYRDYSNDFVGAVGDTITVRKPASFVVNEFTDAITVQDAAEESVLVTMDKHLDVSFKVSARQMSMDIEDFSAQLLTPAMQAFADKIDKYLIDIAKSVSGKVTMSNPAAPGDILAARKILTQNAAPMSDRHLVLGVDAEADLLGNELFISAEKVGDEGSALREASLGRKFGFDTYVDQNADNAAGSYTPALAFHRNAFALVTRQLALPMGAQNAAIVNYDGFGLRVVYGYDMATKSDTVSIDMLCGVKLLDEKLAAVIVGK